jgi:hypothetical protein
MQGDGGAGISLNFGANRITNERSGVIRGGAGHHGGSGIELGLSWLSMDMGSMGAALMSVLAVGKATANITNNGLIVGGAGTENGGAGIYLMSGATATITNNGVIDGGAGGTSYGIVNDGYITNLTNAQGGSASHALSLSGRLPEIYTTVLGSQASYGQLAISNADVNRMTVEVSNPLGSALATQKFRNVVTGAEAEQVVNQGKEYAFNLANGVLAMLGTPGDNNWDLRVLNFGRDLAEPQRTTLEQRNYGLRYALSYNCDSFGENGFCVSFQANNTNSFQQNQTAGVLIGAARVSDNVQVGVFRESGAQSSNGLEIGGVQPLTGVFFNFASNKDGTGPQGRLVYASQTSKATITRDNTLGAASLVTAKADVDAMGTEVKLGWGIGLSANHVLTPFLAYTSNKAARLAYSEANATGVDAPFSYSEYSMTRSAVAAGVGVTGQVNEAVRYNVSLGAEQTNATMTDFGVSGAFGKATYNATSPANGMGYSASAGVSFKVSDNVSVHVNAGVLKLDTNNDAVNYVSAGLRIGF